MPQRTDLFELAPLGLSSGEGRRLDLHTAIEPFDYGGQSYSVEPELVPVRLDVSRTTGSGWVRTWPYAGNRLPPFVQLDHVLSRGLTVIDSGQVAMNGTDHAAVWGSYALPGAGGR